MVSKLICLLPQKSFLSAMVRKGNFCHASRAIGPYKSAAFVVSGKNLWGRDGIDVLVLYHVNNPCVHFTTAKRPLARRTFRVLTEASLNNNVVCLHTVAPVPEAAFFVRTPWVNTVHV